MLLRGDALRLPLRDGSVDAVVSDPPYADQMTMFGVTVGQYARRPGHSDDEDLLAWTAAWCRELYRVLRPGGVAYLFSSARTFRYLSSEEPPLALGVRGEGEGDGEGDVTWAFSPTDHEGALERVGFTFRALHTWMYGTGRPRQGVKPAWEAIVEAQKAAPGPRRTGPADDLPDLMPTLRALLPRLDADRRALAEHILRTPDYDRWRLLVHPAFLGAFDHLRPALTRADFQEPETGARGEDFYVPKPSVAEQNAGLEGLPRRRVTKFGPAKILRQNTHPTPKPVKLMRILVSRACPHGGTVLDPFAGSGTTGVACVHEGCTFIGLEQNPAYLPIASRRIAHAQRPAGAADAADRPRGSAKRTSLRATPARRRSVHAVK